MASISVQELHLETEKYIRQAAQSDLPLTITEQEEPVAILAAPDASMRKPNKRKLLPAFAKMMAGTSGPDSMIDLDAIRGER